MADPALPPGFTLDTAKPNPFNDTSTPPLPEGFSLDGRSPVAPAPSSASVSQTSGRSWQTKDKKGRTVQFTAPEGASDDDVRKLAAQAVGSNAYLRSSVDRGVPEAKDQSALTGFIGGVLKPLDNAAGWLASTSVGKAIDRAGVAIGLPSADESIASHDAMRAGNARTGYQTLGKLAGILPTAGFGGASAAGLAANGALGGALLSDHDGAGVGVDAALGGLGGVVGGKIIAPVIGGAVKAATPYAQSAMRSLSNIAGRVETTPVGQAVENGTATVAQGSRKLGDIILSKLAAQGQTPEQAGIMLDQARERGVPLALMDLGDETRGLAASLSRKPGESRTIIRDAVLPRQDAQLDRVQGAIGRDLGPTANVRELSEQMIKKARTDAGPLYDKAYETQVPSTPELEALLQTPAGRSALARAKGIAADERRNPTEMGFAQDADGNVVLNPAPVGQTAARDAARHELTDATDAYRAARATTGAQTAQPLARMEAAREALRKAEGDLAGAPNPSEVAEVPTYSTQTLDYVKRGLDDVIEQYRDKTTGKLVLDEAGRAKQKVLSEFLKEVDALNPDYKAARAVYAGPASLTSALQKGSNIGSKDAETILAETKNLSDAQLEQYRLGVRSSISKQLEARTDASDKVKALIGSPKKRAALAQLFGGEENFGRFMDTLADEGLAAATHARINTGSMTALNLADDADMGGLTGVAVNAGARALSGHGIVRNAVSTLGDLYRYGAGKSGERLRADLAAGLSETDPVALKDALAAARASAGYQSIRNLGKTGIGRNAAAAPLTVATSKIRN